jgi:dephospho-CoA kinase
MFPNIPWNPKPRMEYERFGKAMRDIDENVWINKVARNVDQNAKYSIIITDVRQPNEAKWCKENGFTLIYVNASDYVRRERANNETTFLPVLPSESEMWTIDSDYTIDNSGTREELEAQVATLLQKLGETK